MALEIGAWFRKLFGKVEEPKQNEEKRVGGEMTAREAGEAMQAGLSGVGAEFTDGFQSNSVKPRQEEPEKPGFWQRPIGKAVTVVGAAAVGALGGFALIGGLGGALVGGVAVGLLGLASCQKQPPVPSVQININDEDTTNVYVDMGDLLQALKDIKAAIEAGNTKLQEIYDKLVEIQGKLNDLDQNQTNLLNAVNNVIVNADTGFTNLMDALYKILAQLETMDQHQADNTTIILNAIAQMDDHMQMQFGDLMHQLMDMDHHQQAGMTAILAAIVQLDQHQQENAAAMMQELLNNNELLQQILDKMDQLSANQQVYFQQIIAQLMGMSGDLQALLNAMNLNNELLNQILNKMDLLNAAIQNAVTQLLAKLDQIDQHNQQGFLNVINHLDQFGAMVQQGITEILGKLDQLDATLQAGILAILNKLDQMDANQQQAVLAILNKLTQLDANNQEGLSQIIALLQGLNAQNTALFAQLLAKLDNIEANQVEQIQQLAAILAAIQNGNVQLENIMEFISELDLGDGVNLDVIVGLLQQLLAQAQANGNTLGDINANQLTQIQQLAAIYAAIQSGNVQLDNIATMIANLDLGSASVNLDAIEGLLQQILAQSQTNGQILGNMQNNQTLIINAINQLKAQMMQVVTNQEEQTAWLEEIFNKIPTDLEGCNCDCETIIQLLITITEYLENGWNHEGIIDDFGDLLD